MDREELINEILKRLVDYKFANDAEDRPIIDDESIYEFLHLLSDSTIGDINADLGDMLND